MRGRLIPIVLLGWVVIGLLVWLLGSDEVPEPDAADTPAEAEEEREAQPREADAGPGLRQAPQAGSADALMGRLDQTLEPEERAELTAWIRAHPERICELMAALENTSINYAHREYVAFLDEVLAPLEDLKPQLAAGLLDCLRGLAAPERRYGQHPVLRWLRALVPLPPDTRRGLEAWARANESSLYLPWVAALVLDSARSGADIESFLRWMLTPLPNGKYRVLVRNLGQAVGSLGTRGRSLIPLFADFLLKGGDFYGVVSALIQIGPDDPVAQRALVGVINSRVNAQGAAWRFLTKRPDAKEILLAALKDELPQVRMGAVSLFLQLRLVPQETLLPALLATLPSSEVLWRDRAMRMVPSIAKRAEDVVPTLEAMFRSHEEAQWQTAAMTLRLLAGAHDGRFAVADTLRDALRHDNVGVRRVVVQGLMNYAPREAVPMLRAALRDDDAVVREKASDALGELAQGDKGALAALKEAVNHSDPKVVEMAEAWIEEIEALAAEAAGK